MKNKIQIDVRGWLERKLGDVKDATFPDVRVNCPYCGDARGRLYVAVEDGPDEDKGDGYCQNQCGKVHFFRLFRDLENLTDAEAFEQLYSTDPTPSYCKSAELWKQYCEGDKKEQALQQEVPVVWPSDYVKLWGLPDTEWKHKIPQYMVTRKLDKVMCDRYYLGYCGPNSERHLGMAGRMIVPIYQHGKLVGYQGRGMHPAIKPKYLFMKGIKAGDFLYNLDNISAEYESVILVEGVFDVWGVIRCGFPNVVCSFGKHLTEKGVKTLTGRFNKVIVFWDMDAKQEIVELAEHIEGMIGVWVSQYKGKDPDEADPKLVQVAIQNALPYGHYFMREVWLDKLGVTI